MEEILFVNHKDAIEKQTFVMKCIVGSIEVTDLRNKTNKYKKSTPFIREWFFYIND
ncbi:hypothetical protein ACFVSS_27810 [Peribacillus butanolivorans]|uniref:hypothetical protein n=1 Tax=Peribacillus butanolivorans TaxID=421767 RepID=UPI0036DC6CB8